MFMGMLQRILVRKDFYKSLNETPRRRFVDTESINLMMFNEDVKNFIIGTESKINVCLNAFFSDLNVKIKINRNKSTRSKLVFYNVDNPHEEYKLENGEVVATGSVVNNDVISYARNNKSKIEKVFLYYDTIVSAFALMSVPINARVDYRYGFFEDAYFYLKAENGFGGVQIYRVDKEVIDNDTVDCYHFNLDELQEVFDKTIVPGDYVRAYDTLRNCVNAKEQKVRDEISVELKKQESKRGIEEKLEDKFIEILELQKELNDIFNEKRRITISSNYLFEEINGTRRIKKKWLPYLPYINLSKVNLTEVDISGVDFSYTNLRLNPQIVYNKNLRYCRFVTRQNENKIFDPTTDFTGCLLEGTYIEDANVKKGIDYNAKGLKIINRSEYHN